MGTFVGRYTPVDVGRAASYDTLDEQAAAFVTQLNAATHADALPDVGTGATAKWVNAPTVAAASTSGATSTYKDDTVIDLGMRHLRVTAPDVDSTANVGAMLADAIDQAVLGTLTVAAGDWTDAATMIAVATGQDAAAALLGQMVGIDGFAYVICETEIIKVTAVDGLSLTAERGALSSTAASHVATTPIYWYCGPDNTVIGLDDETVWGTPDHLVLLCGTEQMLVTAAIAGTVPDTLVVTRGYDGTTAAVHADNAAVTEYVDEASTTFSVTGGHGALLLADAFYKVETGGTEVIQVTDISTDRITVERAQNGSVAAPIAAAANLFRCWGPEVLDVALAAVNATEGMPDFEEYGGPPINTLGTSPGGAVWSSESQVSAE